jgi:hypothetical protein
MKSMVWLAGALTVLSTSCRKDPAPVPADGRSTSIAIGDLAGMTVVDSNLVLELAFGSFSDTLKLQLDGDGDAEIMFTVTGYSTPQLGYISEIQMLAGNPDIGLRTLSSADTSWTLVDTDTILGGQWDIEVRTLSIYDCEPFALAAPYSVDTEDVDLVVLDAGTNMAAQDVFGPFTDLVHRSPGSTKSMVSPTGFSGDTVFTSQSMSTFNCDYVPLGAPTYVGFKWIDGGLARLGWVHFTIVNPREVHVHQLALQSN